MQLGAYQLISKLGAGGMGEVWRAEDTRLLRPVAIKILSERIANDPEWKARFLREARTIAQVNHPNIATIYAIEQEGSALFIVMELVEGEPLTDFIARGPMPVADAIRIVRQTADALVEAHEKGIVHRDVKPDNILLSRRLVKVVDFGIAKQMEGGTMEDAKLTQGGVIMGTPFYMSPEQALAKTIDRRTDIFSLGVVLFEALTGKRPFVGQTVTETIMHIIMTPPPEIADLLPALPREVVEIVHRAMQKKPEARFQTMLEFAEALEHLDVIPRKKPTFPGTQPSTASKTPTVASHPSPSQRATTTSTKAPSAEPRSTRRVASGPQRDSQPLAATPRAEGPTVTGQRALVADDDPVTRHLIGSALARNRIAFDEVSNGADAVKQIKLHKYTLIFLDLLMPRIDGWGVLDFIRTRKDQQPRLFIVTGVKDQTLSEVDRDVVKGVIFKPLDAVEVDQLVQREVAL